MEDDIRVRESIARLAESAGYAVLMFPSAEALLESTALERASCLITDVYMSGMNGLELQQRAKAERPTVPVIMISAHLSEDLRKRALSSGAIDFLYKPFDGEELLGAIRKALKLDSKS